MKVQFLKKTKDAIIPSDLPDKTLVIYRDGFGYTLPDIKKAEYIEFLEYKNKYSLLEPEYIVVVGLNRIITPSNRCDMVNEYLQTMTPSTPKICIDTDPFIGEPWRLWFHYSIANCGKFNITYSYAIETEWRHWFLRDERDCRLSADNIKLFITDTISDIEPFETQFELSNISTGEEKWYQDAKQSVFKKFDTPKMLINNLLKITNRHFGLKISYDSFRQRPCNDLFDDNTKIILPNVGIYRFMIEENKRRMKIYNEVVNYENIHA